MMAARIGRRAALQHVGHPLRMGVRRASMDQSGTLADRTKRNEDALQALLKGRQRAYIERQRRKEAGLSFSGPNPPEDKQASTYQREYKAAGNSRRKIGEWSGPEHVGPPRKAELHLNDNGKWVLGRYLD